MALDPEEHARRREERLSRDRENARKLGIFLLVAVAVLAVAGGVAWAVFRFVLPRDETPVVPPAEATASVDTTLTFPAGTFEPGDDARVAKGKETINQRKEPRTNAPVVTTLMWPQRVKVLDRVVAADGKVWYLVASWDGTNEGPRGWVRGDLIEED